ncbi:reticulon-1-A-like [Teleopsis dalmanni]|uniref:reticulon-1-A-like n=1 Tax=Teleopsis dalmanni TaxID=139649 RepID=UPI0018CD2605|nr:reticulon-1-A-like [Teleopsis dalmanni]
MEATTDKYTISPYATFGDNENIRLSFLYSILNVKAWFKPEILHPIVEAIIYWHNIKATSFIFCIGITLLSIFACLSLISVLAYAALLFLALILGIKIYSAGLQIFKQDLDDQPFCKLLDLDLYISLDWAEEYIQATVPVINDYIAELHRLFFFDDLKQTIKFALGMFGLAKLGMIFNLTSLLSLVLIILLTLPKLYEVYQQTIDSYIEYLFTSMSEVVARFQGALKVVPKKSSTLLVAKDDHRMPMKFQEICDWQSVLNNKKK